tara:strand:+ start:71 stop:217 length:147 start_codon:yes stop_codon:yes gene_type:complete
MEPGIIAVPIVPKIPFLINVRLLTLNFNHHPTNKKSYKNDHLEFSTSN